MPKEEISKTTIKDITPTNSNNSNIATPKYIPQKSATQSIPKTIPQKSAQNKIPTPKTPQKPIKKIKAADTQTKKEKSTPAIKKSIPQKPIKKIKSAGIHTSKEELGQAIRESIPQEVIKKIKPKYVYAGKAKLTQTIGESIPKQFIPTERLGTILGLIYLAVVVLALVQFPLDKLLSGNADVIIGIGYPWPFLEFQLQNPEEPPIRYLAVFLDLVLYLILAYVIDILINIINDLKVIKTRKELRKMAKVYENEI